MSLNASFVPHSGPKTVDKLRNHREWQLSESCIEESLLVGDGGFGPSSPQASQKRYLRAERVFSSSLRIFLHPTPHERISIVLDASPPCREQADDSCEADGASWG